MTIPASDGLPLPDRIWAAGAIWLAVALAVIDGSIANVALPTIAHDLGASPASSIWVVNAYQIAITMVLLPAAALAERIGHRRMFASGLLVFVAASLGCMLADTLTTLAIMRFIQGLGATGIMAINGALVRFIYPKAQLGRGVGYNATVVAVSLAAGPSLAAAILATTSWPMLFAINIPTGLLALGMSLRFLPDTPRTSHALDRTSTLLSMTGIGALFFALSELARGNTTLPVLSLLMVGFGLTIALVHRSRRLSAPLVPVDLIRIPVLRHSYISAIVSHGVQMMAFVALPFYLQGRFGLTHVATGLLLTIWPLAVAMTAPLAGHLVEQRNAGSFTTLGLGLLASGLGLLAMVSPGCSPFDIAWRMAICGMGFGLFQTPNVRTMLGAAPPARSGAAAGMMAMTRLTGQTLGALIVALSFHLSSSATNMPLIAATIFAGIGAAYGLKRAAQSE